MAMQMRNKPDKFELVPFNRELHTILIAEGFTSLTCHGEINKVDFADLSGHNSEGYAITAHSWFLLEDGMEKPYYGTEITISKCIELPKDPDSEIRKQIIQKHPFAGQVDEILKVFGEKDDLPYRVVGWPEKAPDDVKVTDRGVTYPITSHRIQEMYSSEIKGLFYLLLNRGQNTVDRLLYRKIIASMGTGAKGKRLRKI